MKRKIKRWYAELIAGLAANNNPLLLWYYSKLYSPKKGSLASFIDTFSKSKDAIKVLQVGANDGITHDPIHKFIKRDKWTGVLLEPLTDVFDNQLKKIYKEDKNIKLLNLALGVTDGQTSIYKIGFSKERWATGLTSFNKAILEKAFENGYVFKQAKKEGIAVPENEMHRIMEEKVEVISVESLNKKYKIEDIDVLQIDTEGYDYELLKLFDFNLITPELIIYENDHLSTDDKASCIGYLKDYNYRIKQFGGNTAAYK